jgi:hypothetical protein
MKKVILTLVLGVAAAASAQTKGDPRCADSPAGNYWMAVTQDSGYCTSPPAASAQTDAAASAQSNTAAQNPTCSKPGQHWVSGYCLHFTPEEWDKWQRDSDVAARGEAGAVAVRASTAQASAQTECYRVTTQWGSYCASTPAEQAHDQQQATTSAQLIAQQKLQQQQTEQQAEYQRQSLQQQAQYQQQLLKQQADIARRQMVLQYLMNMKMPTYTPLPPPVLPSYVAPQNNQIHCTTQTIGGIAYTNCY